MCFLPLLSAQDTKDRESQRRPPHVHKNIQPPPHKHKSITGKTRRNNDDEIVPFHYAIALCIVGSCCVLEYFWMWWLFWGAAKVSFNKNKTKREWCCLILGFRLDLERVHVRSISTYVPYPIIDSRLYFHSPVHTDSRPKNVATARMSLNSSWKKLI